MVCRIHENLVVNNVDVVAANVDVVAANDYGFYLIDIEKTAATCPLMRCTTIGFG